MKICFVKRCQRSGMKKTVCSSEKEHVFDALPTIAARELRSVYVLLETSVKGQRDPVHCVGSSPSRSRL